MAAPVTTMTLNTTAVISFTEPNDNGKQIQKYTLTIKKSDGTYTLDTTYCDGASSAVMTNKKCSIPVSVLFAAPYSLTWGSPVYAQIYATNFIGDSILSDEGNGAVIMTLPGVPTDL